MASTNQSPEYKKSQARFLSAQTDEQRLEALEEMIRTAPKHKSTEKMLANLKTRYVKLKSRIESRKKSKNKKHGIKKSEMQAVFVGLTNSGKSFLLAALTNAKPKIADYEYTTRNPVIGILNYEGVQIQLIDMPAINSEYSDIGIINTADTLLLIITAISEIEQILPFLTKAQGKRLIILNKSDLLNHEEKRKLEASLKSKRYNFCIVSAKTRENLQELSKKIFESFNKIRVYTKQPGKPVSNEPVILDQGSSIKEAVEKILHSSTKIKETKITGPSSKFPNQKVSLSHILKDKDIIEFSIR